MPSESIVITGANGMLGRVLSRIATQQGHAVVALARNACDIANEADVDRLFATHRPNVLFNCAGHTLVDQCEREPQRADSINGHAVGLLAGKSRAVGTRLVHFSTDFVFDGLSTRPYREDHSTRPVSAYGRSKLLGEQEMQRVAPAGWLIIRSAWIFGREGACFPRTMVERSRAGQPLRVVNDQTGSPTYVDDLADAALTLATRSATGIWHVANSGSATWYDVAIATLKQFGLHTQVEPVSTVDWFAVRPHQALRPIYSVLDTTKYSTFAEKPLRPWQDALAAYRHAVAEAGDQF